MTTLIDASAEIGTHPRAPITLEQSGLTLDLVLQLLLKTLHLAGELTGTDLANRMALGFPILEPAMDVALRQHHVEVVGGAIVGRASYRYRITDAGRTRAMLFLESNQYVGVAPVPIRSYRRYLQRFTRTRTDKATRSRIREAFSHLVISDNVLDQLGPAINSRHSMFVYGAPGNGKTVISQAIRNILEGEIAIPHAIEAEGSIIRIFDAAIHEEIALPDAAFTLDGGTRDDRRWVRCRRPMIMVGGELRLQSLELSDPQNAGFYRAPLQTAANGGVLVVDDFGRQQCSPRELLNRWIAPLESRVDNLTLATGQTIELPFMVLVVFATNLNPADLIDEAFLRRIRYKIFAQGPSPSEYAAIFENCCRAEGIPFDIRVVEYLLAEWYATRHIAIRGCHPRDLISHALAIAEYRDQSRELSNDLLDAACAGYFIHESAGHEPA